MIRNWLTGALLWYGHACMRGSDPIITDELYEGTAKSIEGYLAGILFEKAKEEGCTIRSTGRIRILLQRSLSVPCTHLKLAQE